MCLMYQPQVEDAGLYTCLASSPAGEDGRNHWVQVQGKWYPAAGQLASQSSTLKCSSLSQCLQPFWVLVTSGL